MNTETNLDIEKIKVAIRMAKNLNNIIVSNTAQNFKNDPEYYRIQEIFNKSSELEIILDSLETQTSIDY